MSNKAKTFQTLHTLPTPAESQQTRTQKRRRQKAARKAARKAAQKIREMEGNEQESDEKLVWESESTSTSPPTSGKNADTINSFDDSILEYKIRGADKVDLRNFSGSSGATVGTDSTGLTSVTAATSVQDGQIDYAEAPSKKLSHSEKKRLKRQKAEKSAIAQATDLQQFLDGCIAENTKVKSSPTFNVPDTPAVQPSVVKSGKLAVTDSKKSVVAKSTKAHVRLYSHGPAKEVQEVTPPESPSTPETRDIQDEYKMLKRMEDARLRDLFPAEVAVIEAQPKFDYATLLTEDLPEATKTAPLANNILDAETEQSASGEKGPVTSKPEADKNIHKTAVPASQDQMNHQKFDFAAPNGVGLYDEEVANNGQFPPFDPSAIMESLTVSAKSSPSSSTAHQPETDPFSSDVEEQKSVVVGSSTDTNVAMIDVDDLGKLELPIDIAGPDIKCTGAADDSGGVVSQYASSESTIDSTTDNPYTLSLEAQIAAFTDDECNLCNIGMPHECDSPIKIATNCEEFEKLAQQDPDPLVDCGVQHAASSLEEVDTSVTPTGDHHDSSVDDDTTGMLGSFPDGATEINDSLKLVSDEPQPVSLYAALKAEELPKPTDPNHWCSLCPMGLPHDKSQAGEYDDKERIDQHHAGYAAFVQKQLIDQGASLTETKLCPEVVRSESDGEPTVDAQPSLPDTPTKTTGGKFVVEDAGEVPSSNIEAIVEHEEELAPIEFGDHHLSTTEQLDLDTLLDSTALDFSDASALPTLEEIAQELACLLPVNAVEAKHITPGPVSSPSHPEGETVPKADSSLQPSPLSLQALKEATSATGSEVHLEAISETCPAGSSDNLSTDPASSQAAVMMTADTVEQIVKSTKDECIKEFQLWWKLYRTGDLTRRDMDALLAAKQLS